DASATATTATNSATYLVNRRLRILPRLGAAADAGSAAAEAASVRPSGVSGCSEMLIGPQLSKKVQACLLRQCGSHSITSSASASRVGGISNPAALAVLRFRTKR